MTVDRREHCWGYRGELEQNWVVRSHFSFRKLFSLVVLVFQFVLHLYNKRILSSTDAGNYCQNNNRLEGFHEGNVSKTAYLYEDIKI